MKFSKLLVLTTLWLSSLSVSAAIVDGVRQKPTPQTSGFAADQEVYIYNTEAKLFFTQGNSWATQASVSDEGRKMKFEVAADGVYLLSQYNWRNASDPGGAFAEGWRYVFFDSETGIFCDRNGQANYGWAVEENGATFRLHAADGDYNPSLSASMFPDMYVGLDVTENSNNTALHPFLAEGEGHYLTWAVVSPDEYERLMPLVALYNKSKELKAVLDKAEAAGLDVSAEKAVYLNEDASESEMDSAIASLNDKLASVATVSNPSDMTSLIANPSYDNNSNTGWSGTAPAFQSYTDAEFYEKNYNYYQDLSGLPEGVYAVGVQAFFRPGSTADSYTKWPLHQDLNAKVYARASGDSLQVSVVNIFEGSTDTKFGVGTEYGPDGTDADGQSNYVPNNMQAAEEYFLQGRYHNTVFMGVNNGELRLGLRKDDSNFGMNWTIWDNWTLTFYGNQPEAYQYWLDQAVKNSDDITPANDVVYTYSYLNDYNSYKKGGTASSRAEVLAFLSQMETAAALLEQNVALWKEYAATVDKARSIVNNDAYDHNNNYYEACEDAIDDYNRDSRQMSLTNEKLRQKIDQLNDNINEASKRFSSDDVNVDVTNTYLVNPDFSAGNWDGWTREGNLTGSVAVNNSCGEAWNTASFDIYQEVADAPTGVYEISVQGFYRYGRGDNAWNTYQNQSVNYVRPNGAPCFVYMNDLATPFMNVFDEAITDNSIFTATNYNTFTGNDGNNYYAPNDMATAANCFASPSQVYEGQNMFTQKAYGLVVHKGDPMRVGVKGSSNQLGDSWCIFDNFKLTYRGNAASVVSEVLLSEVEAAEKIEGDMGKTAYQNLTDAIANARSLAAGSDGDAMFEALLTLMDAEAAAKESMSLFDELISALNDLGVAIKDGENEDAKPGANLLKEDIEIGMEDHDIEDSEVPELIIQIKEWKTKLYTPAAATDATDSNPCLFDMVIDNPSYDSGNNNGWEGTSAAVNTEVQNAEIFGGDEGMSFDYYQDIYGLLEGTYEVSVVAFYRAGLANEDYESYRSNSGDNAFLYATSSNGRSSKALSRLAANTGWYTSDNLPSGWTWADESASAAVPNTMVAAHDYFDDYKSALTTKVNVKVGADGKLRIGLVKEEIVAKDWTIFDEWMLTYFGKNSSKEISDDQFQGVEEIVSSAVKAVEFYTVDGRKTNMNQKGIVIMRQTQDNGTVVIKKIRK